MPTTTTHYRTPRVRNLIAFSSCIMLLFGVIVLYQAFREFDIAKEKGKQNAERLVTILSDQIELTFLTVDLSLQRAVERQYMNQLFGGHLPEDMVQNFKVWIRETPQIISIMLVNHKGGIELAVQDPRYDGWMNYEQSMEQTEPFLELKNNPDKEVYVGPNFNQNSEYGNLIVVARRIYNIDGTFGGIVLATVYSEYFLDFFRSVDAGTKRYMSLMLSDGRNLFADTHHPRSNNTLLTALMPTIIKNDQTSSKLTTKIEDVDGSLELLSYKFLPNLPLVVSVIIDEEDFLSAFWQERFKDLSFLAIFTVFGSVLSFFALTMAKQIIRVEESEAAAILASQAKSEFLANMSHELRTPLNAIIGFSEMMNSGYFGPLNAKQKERMNDINLCGNHLLHLISDILEFSKGEAGKLEIVEEKIALRDIIDEVVRMMGEKVKSKDVRLTTDVPVKCPLLFADKRKVKQILLNLVSNAVKFTPQSGEIKLTVRVDGNGALVISVADTGIGIAEEDIPTALSVFGQVHRSRSHEGTGLGLPLCRMFAELHGGKLALASVVGEGTTVRVIFPAQRVIYQESDEDAMAS